MLNVKKNNKKLVKIKKVEYTIRKGGIYMHSLGI